MIYLEPATFGWRPILTSWLLQLPPALADHTPLISSLVDWLVPPCLDLVQRKLKELVVTSESNLTRSLMHFFVMMMSEAVREEKAARENKNLRPWIVVREGGEEEGEEGDEEEEAGEGKGGWRRRKSEVMYMCKPKRLKMEPPPCSPSL